MTLVPEKRKESFRWQAAVRGSWLSNGSGDSGEKWLQERSMYFNVSVPCSGNFPSSPELLATWFDGSAALGSVHAGVSGDNCSAARLTNDLCGMFLLY